MKKLQSHLKKIFAGKDLDKAARDFIRMMAESDTTFNPKTDPVYWVSVFSGEAVPDHFTNEMGIVIADITNTSAYEIMKLYREDTPPSPKTEKMVATPTEEKPKKVRGGGTCIPPKKPSFSVD